MANGKNSSADVGLLILRIVLGGIFIAHGVQKLVAENGLANFADTLANLGLPYAYPAAVAAISAEIGGGLLVVLGLFGRLGALSLAAVMVVAIWKVHGPNGFWLKGHADAPGPLAHGFEYNAALLAMALTVVFCGSGRFSILLPKAKKG